MTLTQDDVGPGTSSPGGVLFAAVQPFGPWCGEAWQRYISRTGLTHLVEVVTFDAALCPPALGEIGEADRQHNREHNARHHFFRDLASLLAHMDPAHEANVLGLVEEPGPDDAVTPPGPGFVLRGYDLVDTYCDISVLSSRCVTTFARAFTPEDLNRYGLIDEFDHACRLRNRLQAEYPQEPLADCRVWAMWRKER